MEKIRANARLSRPAALPIAVQAWEPDWTVPNVNTNHV
jgi:hypothetical protein